MATQAQRDRQKEWYDRNRVRVIELRELRRKELGRKLREYKKTLECGRCGFKNPVALQFHHRQDKEFEVSNYHGRSWNTILAEIAKCEVLCANCHAIEHFEK